MNKLYKYLVLFCAMSALTACVTPISLEDQTPDVSYENEEEILVSVIDERQRVKDGKPENYIGKVHSMFGIPVDWHVNQVLATEEGDKDRTLSQFIEHRLVAGLQERGWDVSAAGMSARPAENDVKSKLVNEGAQKLLLLVLNEWYFSINLNWVSKFNFDTNADVIVFDLSDGEILKKNFTERDVIDEAAKESPQNTVLRAYRDQLVQILNDPDVKRALLQ